MTNSSPPLPTHTSSPSHPPPPPHPRPRPRRFSFPRWKGAKPIPLLISISIGIIFRLAVPKPHQLSKNAWQLLAIFLTTISGLVLGPLPVGAWAFLCLTLTVVTKTLTFAAAFAAFTNEVIWLIVTSFFFSRGFIKTGLGDRIALYFVSWLGKNTLGLSYGLALSEAAISPAIPSTTARAGGIFLPIIKSLATTADSHPKNESAKKLGAYLVQSQLQCSSSSSALFLTAAAQNLLCVKLAEGLGVKVPSKWVTWLKASCIPAVLSLAATPIVLYKIFPPEMKDTPDAPLVARRRLQSMGPIKSDELVMIIVMLVTIALWIAGEALGILSVVTAMLGLTLLLAFGIINWDDCLSEKSAWDTLAWFGVLIGMATQLTTLGVVAWMSNAVANFLRSLSLHWIGAFCVLQAAYFFIHYLFASQTGHVAALYSAFLGMCLASKVPGLFAALSLGYITNLFGALTHYSSGQAAVYYGAGYVELRNVFKLGIIIAVLNIVIWALAGAAWWKILGLY